MPISIKKEEYGEDTCLGLYYRDISKNQALKSEREAVLAARIKKGNRKALKELIEANLRFVVSVASQYRNQGMSLSDLIAEGNVGLTRAAVRFDEKKNFRFISYAVWWIRQAILQALADQSRIARVPVNRVAQIHRKRKIEQALEQKLHRLPNDDELREALELENISDVQRLSVLDYAPMKLDAPYRAGMRATAIDRASFDKPDLEEDYLVKHFRRKEIRVLLSTLSDRERIICEKYFGFENGQPLTLEEIGVHLNLTRERVRQLKGRALSRLKDKARTMELHGGVA